MAKKIIVGNWKMNPRTLKEATLLCHAVAKSCASPKKTEIVICPPFLYLERLKKLSKKIMFGAQDAFWGDVGAHTGEVSGEMLCALGTRYVILGHSERRARGEANTDIRQKVRSALAAGLRPILCVGELERGADHGYFNIVKEQLEECLRGVSKSAIEKAIVAYEPVWAISSTPGRKDATAADAREMAIFIRKVLSDKFGAGAARTKILYGGSVNERDAEAFLRDGGVDGLLVGRASLSPDKFGKIIHIAEELS